MKLLIAAMILIIAGTVWRAKFADAETPSARIHVRPRARELDRTDYLPVVPIQWALLRGLDYRSGQVSPEIQAIEDHTVELKGFMVPLEDDAETTTEFLLMPEIVGCIHTPPPPLNQMVNVKTASANGVRVDWENTVVVRGRLSVVPVKSASGSVGLQLNEASLVKAR